MAYDGTDFSGWARQPDRRTVQGSLEEALATQPPGASVPRSVVVAGRTDAGVHAARQVVHVDVEPYEEQPTSRRLTVDAHGLPDLDHMRHRWNRLLPQDVRVLAAHIAPDGFDARFSAVRRHYRYQVSDAPWGVDPLRRKDTLAWHRSLDVDALQEASQALLGLQDFAAYCKQREGATTVRELQGFTWRRVAEYEVHADVSADAFCHSMVRSLVGAALMVGDGRRDVEWPHRVLERRVRASSVAPANGLTLLAVDYPPDDELAARAEQTRNVRDSL